MKQTFYIVEGVGSVFKIYLKDKQPPCVIHFNYHSQTDRNLVRAYYSSQNKDPKVGSG